MKENNNIICPYCCEEIPIPDVEYNQLEIFIKIITLVLFISWLSITILIWLAEGDTLVNVLISQWEWIKNIRVW